TVKTILNRIIEASLSVTDVEGGYPDPPQKIFEQPETPVKKDHPHVARLSRGQSRSLLSFSFMISRRDFGRAAGPATEMSDDALKIVMRRRTRRMERVAYRSEGKHK